MAFTISDDGVITMFKGDTVEFEIPLYLVDGQGNETGEMYAMQTGDKLTFTVRKRPGSQYPVEFSVTSTTNVITILPTHTANMAVGKYSADVQLSYGGGRIATVYPDLNNLTDAQRSSVSPWNNFILTGEVTINDNEH